MILLELQFLRSIQYLEQRRYKKALEILDKLIKSYSDNAKLYYNKGGAHLEWGKSLKAHSMHEKAIDEFQKALETFDKCIELDPEHAEIHYYKGLVYLNLGNMPEAVGNYKKTLEVLPYHTYSIFQLVSALILDAEYENALEAINYYLNNVADEDKSWMFDYWLEYLLEVPNNDAVEKIRMTIMEISEVSEL